MDFFNNIYCGFLLFVAAAAGPFNYDPTDPNGLCVNIILITITIGFKYSRPSLSRLRLSGITAYLEEKI